MVLSGRNAKILRNVRRVTKKNRVTERVNPQIYIWGFTHRHQASAAAKKLNLDRLRHPHDA